MMAYAQMFFFCFGFFSAGVIIGFQQSDITMNEDDGLARICAVIKCGCVRRDIEVDLFTQDDTATGMLWNSIAICMICCWTPPQLLLYTD